MFETVELAGESEGPEMTKQLMFCAYFESCVLVLTFAIVSQLKLKENILILKILAYHFIYFITF